MDMPCRSCGNCSESDLFVGEVAGHIRIHCSEKVPLKDCSVLTYGVVREDQGKALCDKYSHKGFDW